MLKYDILAESFQKWPLLTYANKNLITIKHVATIIVFRELPNQIWKFLTRKFYISQYETNLYIFLFIYLTPLSTILALFKGYT